MGMDTAVFFAEVLALGAGVGIVSAALGIGGGTLMVPAFLWIFADMDMNTAKGSSLFAIMFVSGFQAWEARRAGIKSPWDVVGACAAGSIAGGYAGGALTALLSDDVVTWIFIGLLLFAGVRTFFLKPRYVAEDEVRKRQMISVAIGFVAGVVGGGTGTGGGLILVPLALWAGIASNERVVALSNTVMVATSAAGALAHALAARTVDMPWTYGLVNVSLAPLVCVSAIACTQPGRWINSKLTLPRRKAVMGTILVLIAIQLAYRALG
jgi:uncharacterized membrane protein YfcA